MTRRISTIGPIAIGFTNPIAYNADVGHDELSNPALENPEVCDTRPE